MEALLLLPGQNPFVQQPIDKVIGEHHRPLVRRRFVVPHPKGGLEHLGVVLCATWKLNNPKLKMFITTYGCVKINYLLRCSIRRKGNITIKKCYSKSNKESFPPAFLMVWIAHINHGWFVMNDVAGFSSNHCIPKALRSTKMRATLAQHKGWRYGK